MGNIDSRMQGFRLLRRLSIPLYKPKRFPLRRLVIRKPTCGGCTERAVLEAILMLR